MSNLAQFAPQNPLTEPCRDQMDKKFIWNLHLDVTGVRWVKKLRNSLKDALIITINSCLAMLGCHDLEGTRYGGSNGKEVFDFNVTVNRLKVFHQIQRVPKLSGI